jgi:hypothetical protein
MPRKVSYVPTAPDRGSVATLPVDQIPADVIAEVEEIYTALKANPNGRMRAEFDSKAELNQYMTQVSSYCLQRTINGVAAPLRFRKSPTKGLPETVMDYRISDPAPTKEDAPATVPTAPEVTSQPFTTETVVKTPTGSAAKGAKK